MKGLIHGDTLFTTTTAAGVIIGAVAIYDPFGTPVAPNTGLNNTTAEPATRTGGLTDGWEGSNQRGNEHTGPAN